MQVPEREKEDRRDWIIVLLILLFGFLCILLASGWALRLTPSWRLDSDMESNLDPNGDFLTNKPVDFYEPLDPSILTQPVWADVFLTPGAVLPTKPILPTGVPVTTTSQVLPTQTVVIAITPTNTGLPPTIPPTNTLIYIPPPPTNTPKPPPTKTAIPSADLAITKDDGNSSYIAGNTLTYTITITNIGPGNASGFNITDTVPAAITGVSAICSSAGTAGCGSNNTTGNAVLFSGASINAGAGNSITITVNGTVALGTTGSLSNTADIVIPAGAPFTDPDTASNNSATDTDTLATSGIDLSITKTDGINAYSPGDTLTYTIVVTNPSTSGATATGFNITDTIPLIRNTIVISCNPSSASDSCGTYVPPPPGGTNIAYNGAALSTGQTLTITVQGRVSLWQTGPLSNTANIVIPGGAPFTDPDTGNNTANDTDSASLPTCDSIIDVSGTGNIAITSGFVTCLRFTDPTLTGGATISITNTGFSYLRWNGLDAGGSGTCGIYTGLLWPVGNSLNNIYVDRNGDIILYAQALLGNDTLNISAIADWNTGCP
jgi:uncharacterized repeat protein (TIGR01451 family)